MEDNNYNSDKKDTNTDLLPTPSVVRVMPNTPCFVRRPRLRAAEKTASLAAVKNGFIALQILVCMR